MPTDPAATTVKESSTPAETPAAAESTSTTALSAVESAFKDSSAASSADTGGKPPAEGKPPAGTTATTDTTTAQPGIAQLRSAYDTLKTRLGWAENLDQREAMAAFDEWAAFKRDPVGWYRKLGTELAGHPEYGKHLEKPKEEPEPQPDYYSMVDGEKVPMYSAPQLRKWHEWNNSRVSQQIEERLNPLQGWAEESRTSAERAEIFRGAKSTATRVLTELRQDPRFVAGEEKIAERLAKIDPAIRREIGSVAALHLAYHQYLREEVFPTLESNVEKRVKAEYEKKAAAGIGTIKPGSGSGSAPSTHPTTPAQLAAKFESGAYAKAGQ